MLKLPNRRKSYSYYSNSYYSKPKRQRKRIFLWLILSVPIAIVLLELLARAYVEIAGKSGEMGKLSPLVNAYSLKFLTKTEKPIDGISENGGLVAKRSSTVGYQLVGQKNQFVQINEQGFRDKDSLPLAKPKDEIRIFILGGSTAFGQWNQKNEATIASKLETRLQQRVTEQKQSPAKYRPDVFPFFQPSREKLMGMPAKIKEGQYRVINAAVPGYVSGNQLAQFALQILPYQPDLIVVLDGYGDLMLPSSETQQETPKIDNFLANASGHFKTSISQSLEQLTNNSYLINTIDSLFSQSEPSIEQKSLAVNLDDKSLAQSLPKDDAELSRRVARYQENHQQLIQLSARAGVPVVLALQPEITGRPADKLSPEEKEITEQLEKDYLEKMPKAYRQFAQTSQQLAKAFPSNVKVLNLEQDKNLPPASFSDTVHLSEQANTVIAENIYQTIATSEKLQIIPQNYYLKEEK
jgi:lysophospholipase L1-like esterase